MSPPLALVLGHNEEVQEGGREDLLVTCLQFLCSAAALWKPEQEPRHLWLEQARISNYSPLTCWGLAKGYIQEKKWPE